MVRNGTLHLELREGDGSTSRTDLTGVARELLEAGRRNRRTADRDEGRSMGVLVTEGYWEWPEWVSSEEEALETIADGIVHALTLAAARWRRPAGEGE